MQALLDRLFGVSGHASPLTSVAELRTRVRTVVPVGSSTVESAVLGGLVADRVGYAFAAGYQAALAALVRNAGERPTALCVTEKDGAHPRAIATRLEPRGDGFALHGQKRWTTMASDAERLLVVASTGLDDAGRNRLRVVDVDARARGVTMTPMPETPFAPEIRHAEVAFEDVAVRAGDLLPGDGYERYVKPFRTVEDIHVMAALLGYLFGVARDRGFASALREELLASIAGLCALASGDPSSPVVHLALAGVLRGVERVVGACEAAWEASATEPDDALARWRRDKPLLAVAQGARAKRLEAAWKRALVR